MLRDVRSGAVVQAVGIPGSGAPPRTVTAPRFGTESPAPSRAHELFAQFIGKSVVLIPVAVIVAFGLWTGYESGAAQGLSVFEAAMISVGSLALTVGLAFVWASRRRGHH
jgi:cation transporter-like permease